MIYDCFTFFNELDLLELRLETLDSVVDKFVLVEGTKSYTNNDKPLYYNENKKRFEKWNDKIIHIIVDNYPEYKTSWTYENYLRNCITSGLKNCNDDDVIIISDLDEIPNPESVSNNSNIPGIKSLELKKYQFYLNYYCYTRKWIQSKMFHYSDFFKPLKCKYGEGLIKELNIDTTPTKIFRTKTKKIIRNAGWHFTYLGGIDKIRYKLYNYGHQDEGTKALNDDKIIETVIKQGIAFSKRERLMSVLIDESFPRPLQMNKDKYSVYICDFKVPNKLLRTYYKMIYNRLFYRITDTILWYLVIKKQHGKTT